MQPNVPIPTDNLYKFQALFGLVLIVTSITLAVFVQARSASQIEAAVSKRDEVVASQDSLIQDVHRAIERSNDKIDSIRNERTRYSRLLWVLAALGGAISANGFRRWAKIQPLHDELLELQVAKARKEAHGSNVYRELPKRPDAKKPAKKAK